MSHDGLFFGGGGSIMLARKATDYEEDDVEGQTNEKATGFSSSIGLEGNSQLKATNPVASLSSNDITTRPNPALYSQPVDIKPKQPSYTSTVPAAQPNTQPDDEETHDNRIIFGGSGSSKVISRKIANSREQIFEASSKDSSAALHSGQQTPSRVSKSARLQVSFFWPGEISVIEVLTAIGDQRGWSQEEIRSDATAFANQRIRTVDDLRVISKETWDSVSTVLPIVKDLLRQEITRAVL